MLYDSTKWWQVAIEATSVTTVVIGLFWLLTPILGRRRRTTATPRQLVRNGLLLVAAGVLLHVVTLPLTTPKRDPIGRTRSTPSHFYSTVSPTVELAAPPGWTLQFNENPGGGIPQLQVMTGNPSEGTAVVLVIETVEINDFVSLERTTSNLAATFRGLGLTVESEPQPATIANRPARGLTTRRPDGTRIATWAVQLGGNRVANVQCFVPEGRALDHACQAPLDALRWTD